MNNMENPGGNLLLRSRKHSSKQNLRTSAEEAPARRARSRRQNFPPADREMTLEESVPEAYLFLLLSPRFALNPEHSMEDMNFCT